MEFSLSPPMEVSRRSISSPEFEFWMVGSTPQPDLLTADELFVDGVLLPLHLLSLPRSQDTDSLDITTAPTASSSVTSNPPPPPSASITCTTCTPPSASKRWKDIFKVGEKKTDESRKKERKSTNPGGAAELNINIWPFSRSRSAGNNIVRPRLSTASRKISSAPCSRSNSRGESSKLAGSASRRCAASPGRNSGVHLGRASPVWRRPDKVAVKEKGRRTMGGNGGTARGLSLNVNTCIGYRSQVSCRSDDSDGVAAAGGGGLFKLRTLFTKKVY